MVALGRPGAGEALLKDIGFTEVERIEVPFVFEFCDPRRMPRALASTGPAFEAIQAAGEDSFLEMAVETGSATCSRGLPLRAPIALVGYIAIKPAQAVVPVEGERCTPAHRGRLSLGRSADARCRSTLRRRPRAVAGT